MKTSLSVTGIYVLLFVELMFILVQGTLSGALDSSITFRFRNWQWILIAFVGAGSLFLVFKKRITLLNVVIAIVLVAGSGLLLLGS